MIQHCVVCLVNERWFTIDNNNVMISQTQRAMDLRVFRKRPKGPIYIEVTIKASLFSS